MYLYCYHVAVVIEEVEIVHICCNVKLTKRGAIYFAGTAFDRKKLDNVVERDQCVGFLNSGGTVSSQF